MSDRDTTVALVAAEMAGSDWEHSRTFGRQAYLDDVDQVFAAAERLGYAVVPTNSTKLMDEAGAEEVRAYDHRLGDTGGIESREVCAGEVYRAMIAAARES